MKTPSATLVHHSLGRTRIRIPSKKKDQGFFRELKTLLSSETSVREVLVNLETASLLIIHECELDTLTARLNEIGMFDLAKPNAHHKKSATVLSSAKSKSEALNLRKVAGMTLLGLGILQILRGHALGAASTLFKDALGLVSKKT